MEKIPYRAHYEPRSYTVTFLDGLFAVQVEALKAGSAKTLATQKAIHVGLSNLPYTTLCLSARVHASVDHRFGPRNPEDPRLSAPTINLENVTEEQKQHFVGFWEGDGSVGMHDDKRPYLMLSQKNPQILEYFRTLFNLEEPVRNNHPYQLTINRRAHTLPILEIIKQYVVLPHRVSQLGRRLTTGDIAEHDPTWPWTAGIVDAEGSASFCTGSFQLSISQRDPRGLEKIKQLVGVGNVYPDKDGNHELRWSTEPSLRITQQIYPYMQNQQKKHEIYALLTYLGKLEEV